MSQETTFESRRPCSSTSSGLSPLPAGTIATSDSFRPSSALDNS
jgi:hypothetical protein